MEIDEMRKARLTVDIGPLSDGTLLPADTEVVIEREYAGGFDVSAYYGTLDQQDIWVKPEEIEEATDGD